MHGIQQLTFLLLTANVLQGCGGPEKTVKLPASTETKLAAMQTLQSALRPADATSSSSTEIDWSVGSLPWNRYSLPVISPNGLHAAVQLGSAPDVQVAAGNSNELTTSSTLELHVLDPMEGRRFSPFHVSREGLILGRTANDRFFLVESPNVDNTRWIGKIDWSTGNIRWIISDEYINAFPTINALDDIAWSRRSQDDDRFHIVVKTARGQRAIDDGKSDWLMPSFLGINRLRAYRLRDGQFSLVELDLQARDPLLTAISLPITETGATRAIVWQIATTNPTGSWSESQAFYHPAKHRMIVWQPGEVIETATLLPNSVAATPVSDGSWLVATDKRIVRQELGNDSGIHIRNRLAIPIVTTSQQWTHYMLIPQGARLEVRAINLD